MRSPPFILTLGLLALLARAALAEPATQKWQRLTGAELHSAFTDAELADGAHYRYRFHPDGSFDGIEMQRKVLGRWRATAETLCWRWILPAGREECYTVARNGREVRGWRDGRESWWGELAPRRSAAPHRKE